MAEEANALVELISSSTSSILKEYAVKGVTLPSLLSTDIGPFDLPEQATFELLKNLRVLEGAAAQLVALLAPPGHNVINKSFGHLESAAFRVVISHKIADILTEHPAGLPVAQIAERSKLDEGKLYRILRFLATKHVFIEVQPRVFANNRLSVKLKSTEPVASYVGHNTDEGSKSFAYLDETLSDPKLGSSTAAEDTAFTKAHGIPIFEFYAKNPAIGERFNQAMVGWGEVTGRNMLAKVYPWEHLTEEMTIVDIGGGNGHAVLDVVRKHANVKAIVQDMPKVVEDGIKFWEKEYPEALQNGRAKLLPLDFFASSPVENADIYYLRHVLHDWPDAQVKEILKNVRKSAKERSKLLIHEVTPQPATRLPNASYDQAPVPLLPNYGLGKARAYYLDMQMLALGNAMERNVEDFKQLVEPIGFKFHKVYDLGEAALIEFVVV